MGRAVKVKNDRKVAVRADGRNVANVEVKVMQRGRGVAQGEVGLGVKHQDVVAQKVAVKTAHLEQVVAVPATLAHLAQVVRDEEAPIVAHVPETLLGLDVQSKTMMDRVQACDRENRGAARRHLVVDAQVVLKALQAVVVARVVLECLGAAHRANLAQVGQQSRAPPDLADLGCQGVDRKGFRVALVQCKENHLGLAPDGLACGSVDVVPTASLAPA